MKAVKRIINKYRHNKDILCIGLITFVIVLANILPLVNIFPTNPINHRTGLALERQYSKIPGEHTIDPNDGFTSQALGNRAADEIIDGDMPLWNEYEGIGFPLAAEMQSAALFPLNILHKFSNGILYIHTILELVAAIATYLFLRKLKIRRAGSMAGGILYGLAGTMAWLTNAAFNPVAFLPLLMLGVEYMRETTLKNIRGGWILFAISLALAIYAGFPESVYLYAILPIGWAVLRFFDVDKKYRRAFAIKVFTAGFVGILLAAPILVLFGMYLIDAYTGSHGEGLATYSLPLYAVPSLFLPYIYGPIFGVLSTVKDSAVLNIWGNVGGYVSFGVIFLCSFAYKTTKVNKKYVIFLYLIAIIYLLRIYGLEPLVHLLNIVPGMDLLAVYRYAFPAVSFALIILAILGIEELTKIYKENKVFTYFAIAGIALGFFAMYASGLAVELNTKFVKLYYVASIGLALGVLIALFLARYVNMKIRYYVICLVLVFEAVALYVVPQFSTDTTKGVELSSVEYLQNNLGNDRFYTLGPIEPNYGSYYEIASINNNDLPVPKNWADYIENRLNSNTDPVLFTGTFQSDPNGPSPKDELFRNIDNYKNVGLKYIVVGNNALFTDDEVDAFKLEKVHSDAVATIYKVAGTKPYFEIVDGACEIRVQSKTHIVSSCDSQSTLVRRELYMDGWYTNISKTYAYGEYGIFQAITVPQGTSEIIYDYDPPYVKVAYGLFPTGILIIFGTLIGRYKR